MRLKLWIPMLAALLAGCATGPAPRPNVSRYDFGRIEAGAGGARIDVRAPSWLDSDAMQYRMSREPARRQVFAESRWVASPAQLLASALRQQLGGTGNCHLHIDLDEFVQVFDDAGQSRVVLSLHATLQSARAENLALRSFSLEQPAGADARSGVAAFVQVEQRLAAGLSEWLAPSLARCRG